MKVSMEERFWRFVDKSPGHGPRGDCWIWKGSTRPGGYGTFGLGGRDDGCDGAHRVSFCLANGRAPRPGFDVCHRCDVRNCVNPDHLWEGTRRENLADMDAKGRRKVVVQRGEAHVNAKLSDADAALIRTLGGGTCKQIARMFDVSESLVKQIRRGVARRVATCPMANDFSGSGRLKREPIT